MTFSRRKSSADTPVGKSRQDRRSIYLAMLALQSAFGPKAALQIALRADADERSAERWLSDKGGDPSAENFAALLRSDAGGVVLAAVMGADETAWPEWYRATRRQLQLAALRRGLSEQKRQLAALEEAS
jgi:hypothetical protein